MAEVTADLVCRKLGLDAPCRTREQVLLPHEAYYGLLRRATVPAGRLAG